MEFFLPPQLSELQALRGNPIIVYDSPIDSESVRVLYECLQQLGPTQQLDLVLSTTGGMVTVARRLALLLREYTQHLNILVPNQARSSGTLLCLSANELVLGPMAELGPIDVHMGPATTHPSDAPTIISAEDIRAFRQMAEDWFGVKREEDRLQVLALVAQRIFPASLSSFYRSDRLTRQAAHELLRYQLPDVEESVRRRIVDQLVGGYDAHDHVITRVEARSLGLQVHFASADEERLLWDLAKARRQLSAIGLIMSAHFCAHRGQRQVDPSLAPGQETQPGEEGEFQAEKKFRISWEIERK